MTPFPRPRRGERGEGKIGCIISLLLTVAVVVACLKLVPVYYHNDQLEDAAGDLCEKAGLMNAEAMEVAVRNKAKDLDIPEALPRGAVEVLITGDTHSGTCTVHLRYTRLVDFFGAYQVPVVEDKKVIRRFMDSR